MQLPTQTDFDPWDGCHDALHAWEEFGGLTISEAYVKFCENPDFYQEDFMFMGGVAFAYYFPVIERYIAGIEKNEEDDGVMWILAYCIREQLNGEVSAPVEQLIPRIVELAEHVRVHLAMYNSAAEEQARIDAAWAALQNHAVRHRSGQ